MIPPKIFISFSSTKVTEGLVVLSTLLRVRVRVGIRIRVGVRVRVVFEGQLSTGASFTLRTRMCTVAGAEVVVASLTSYAKVSAVTLRSVPL